MENIELLERIYSGKRAQLKRHILNQALLCFLENGLEATTIEMIREQADTSVGAIYHHFKNKEGIIAALFFAALDDQAQYRENALKNTENMQHGIMAMVEGYIDWVTDYPDFARFLYAARFIITQTAQDLDLKKRNHSRNKSLLQWLQQQTDVEHLAHIPHDLLLSLVIGSTENYCRAWLSHKVKTSPQVYKHIFAKTAWRAIAYFPK
ncbi:TetR/AcrR family transcriptional regulator [Acinetobacter defluvii]|uniref:TetR/AcrR family transcriptional regulator n=1 Tax=Acinetobacter defluvii TaxID=1871111 RepID=A0A2S2FBR5_9GAMM|nr:TetR/AcrR family transcriptional regulator [Acinetobacter defluvii]AWL27752.1 TetR/AcrR family transcriptional regulator [Acinetobacter defluvii]